MKKLLLLLICGFCAFTVSAQDIKKKYSSMSNEEGFVYFIHPMKGFKSNQLKSDLEYDITYVTTRDSLTYNFTYYNKSASPVDSVSFVTKNNSTVLPASMIFLEPHNKNGWKYRVTVQVPYVYMNDIYKEASPYQLKVYSKGNESQFEIKEKDWKNQSLIINKIFQVIDLNK